MSLQNPGAEAVDERPTKTKFFSDLSQSVPMSAWRMHKATGHMDSTVSSHFARYRLALEQRYEATESAKPGRQGVMEHVLVVTARVEEMAQLLNISTHVRKKLRTAAVLHDAGKYEERLDMQFARRQGASQWDAYERASGHSLDTMNNRNIDWETMYLASACGHTSIPEAQILLDEQLSQKLPVGFTADDYDDIKRAWLALHYVDDFTRNAEPVSPATIDVQRGILVNDLDRRMDMNRNNSAYDDLNQEGVHRPGFGLPTFDVQQHVGHMVEQRLFDCITAQTLQTAAALDFDPLPAHLPEIIDRLVHSRFVENPAE